MCRRRIEKRRRRKKEIMMLTAVEIDRRIASNNFN
jgi:hypothetical protein